MSPHNQYSYSCVNLLATRRALYRSTEPLDFVLILYIHLRLSGYAQGGMGIMSQVWVRWNAASSSLDVAILEI